MTQPKYMQKIEHWDFDEPEAAGGIITLHYGWSFEPCCHEGVRGFDTKKEAKEAVKNAWKCECNECQKNIQKKYKKQLPAENTSGTISLNDNDNIRRDQMTNTNKGEKKMTKKEITRKEIVSILQTAKKVTAQKDIVEMLADTTSERTVRTVLAELEKEGLTSKSSFNRKVFWSWEIKKAVKTDHEPTEEVVKKTDKEAEEGSSIDEAIETAAQSEKKKKTAKTKKAKTVKPEKQKTEKAKKETKKPAKKSAKKSAKKTTKKDNKKDTKKSTKKTAGGKTTKKTTNKRKPSAMKAFTAKLVKSGKWTRQQIIKKYMKKFPQSSVKTISSRLSDGTNPKFNSFKEEGLIVKDEKTGKLSFKA